MVLATKSSSNLTCNSTPVRSMLKSLKVWSCISDTLAALAIASVKTVFLDMD